jgi:hypothetical protein
VDQLSRALPLGGTAVVVDTQREFGSYTLVEPRALDHDALHSLPDIAVRTANVWDAWATAVQTGTMTPLSLTGTPFAIDDIFVLALVREIGSYVDLVICSVQTGTGLDVPLRFHPLEPNAGVVVGTLHTLLGNVPTGLPPVALCMATQSPLGSDIVSTLTTRPWKAARAVGLYADTYGALIGAIRLAQALPAAA